MDRKSGFNHQEVIKNIGVESILASLLVFLLTVSATCVGGWRLYSSTKESIELKGRVNVVESAKELDNYILVRKSTVMLAAYVVDEMIRDGKDNQEILDYLTAQSTSIKKAIDEDYTGLYGWIKGEYCDGVGWVPDADYRPTERPWYQETMADKSEITFVTPYLDDQTGGIITTLARRLSDGESVVALDVPLTWIQAITERITQQNPGSCGIVLDKSGKVIAHSDEAELGKNYREEKNTLGAALAKRLYNGSENLFELNFRGQKYIVFVEQIEGGWQAVSLIDTDAFYGPLRLILLLAVLLAVLEAAVFLAILYNQSEKNLAIASAREAQLVNRAKTTFLSNMSHEIRTPMNAIIGLNSLTLRDESLSPHTRENLQKIGASASHLMTLINDILDMSRIESGRMELKEERFSLTEVLEQVSIIINGQCDDKGLLFRSGSVGPLEEFYLGDDLKLKQVLINILGNAVKFTNPPGEVSFTVEQSPVSEDCARLRFTMADTGIGMDAAFLPKLFESFTQEDGSTTNEYGGSGLGMAITKSIVDMMGGEIEVQSEKGVGSTFVVTVPLKRAPGEQTLTAGEDAQPSEEPVSLVGRHILIAEDQEMNAEILSEILELEDMTSEWAQNGRQAVELFEQSEAGHFDAILMDMRMPVMDGLAASRAIRGLSRPDAAKIPIIALTANAFEEDVNACLQAGMNAHLSKPVDIDLLKDTLVSILCAHS